MTALIYTLGVVLFILGVIISIALHEVGHMYPAKKFGIKVTQYFVGFGNTVWSTKRGETEYGIKAIPLGGYVRLVGMLPPAKTDNPHKVRAPTRACSPSWWRTRVTPNTSTSRTPTRTGSSTRSRGGRN